MGSLEHQFFLILQLVIVHHTHAVYLCTVVNVISRDRPRRTVVSTSAIKSMGVCCIRKGVNDSYHYILHNFT